MKFSSIIRKYLCIGLMAASGIVAVSCHDDDPSPAPLPIRAEVTEQEGYVVSSFSLDKTHFQVDDQTSTVMMSLMSRDGSTRVFEATVKPDSEGVRFSLKVPEQAPLSDGSYIITMRRADSKPIAGRLKARFTDRMVTEVSIILPTYMLDGEGTEESPYIIASDDDFEMFLIGLCDDTDALGAGLVFSQRTDVTAPDQSSLIPGRGYWGAPFAGIYDGGGHAIKGLFYRGASREESDTSIGLFTKLCGTATVSNLALTGLSMSGLFKTSGAIAGTTSGDVVISGVSVAGYIQDGYAIGGIVGAALSGTLTISDVELRLGVSAGNDVGGVIGRIDAQAAVAVSHVTTPDTHFTVTGAKSVGGIAGRVIGALSVTDVNLSHKVSSEDSDIAIVSGSEGVGGIVGSITADAPELSLTKCYVRCPVGGSEATNVGGIIGQTYQAAATRLKDCRMYSVVSGHQNVGGIVGRADLPSDASGLIVEGDDLATRAAADDADAKVKASEAAGGFAGRWKGKLTLDARVKINLPVTATTSAGGAFGEIFDSTVDCSGFLMGQSDTSVGTTMRVNADTRSGGIAGHLSGATLTGGQAFDYADGGKGVRVPSASRFAPNFAGIVSGSTDVGGIVGYAEKSSIKAVCSAATVTATTSVGGIVGKFYEPAHSTQVEDCTFKGTLSCAGAICVGGIIGWLDTSYAALVHDCINYSDITGGEDTGGIIGRLYKGNPDDRNKCPIADIKWCVNLGSVSGVSTVGGVVGNHTYHPEPWRWAYNDPNFIISYCMNAGKITGQGSTTSSGGVGGIIGNTGPFMAVYYCANHGDIYGGGLFHGIGGIGGSMGADPKGMDFAEGYLNLDVKECVNTATIDAEKADSFVGGILGYQEEGSMSYVNNCHNLGAVPCHQNHDSGGIVGCVDHLTDIHRVVNQGKVSHGNATIGTHKSGSLFSHSSLYFLEGTGSNWPSATKVSEANFSKESSFGGLDFKAVWKMTSTGPVLARCTWRDPSLIDK